MLQKPNDRKKNSDTVQLFLLLVCTVVYHHQHYQEVSQFLLHLR
jgi:hypothetical protein